MGATVRSSRTSIYTGEGGADGSVGGANGEEVLGPAVGTGEVGWGSRDGEGLAWARAWVKWGAWVAVEYGAAEVWWRRARRREEG